MNSIIWPNPEFDNSITVYGPEVKALVKRYLTQMIGELKSLPNPDGGPGTLLDAIDLVIPHQANKNMVESLAEAAGVDPAASLLQYCSASATRPPRASCWRFTMRCARDESTVRCASSRRVLAPELWVAMWSCG